jgi:hypothetical protein
LPTDVARDIVATSKDRLWWRPLYAAPEGGPLAGGDPFRRRFDGFLRKLIMLRDRRCRDPFCDAPIRHIDHIQDHHPNRPHLSKPRAVAQSFQVMIRSVAERPERSTTVIKLFVVSMEVVLTHSDEPMVNRFQAIGLSAGSG